MGKFTEGTSPRQDTWMSKKADEILSFADHKATKYLYSGLKTVYGPTTSESTPPPSADGNTLITDKEKFLENWAECFHHICN